ncbi:MAG: tyrosine recombinase XerC [Polyangiaceae bacterium]
MTNPTLRKIETDDHLVTLWLSGRPVTTRRVYLAEATAFLSSLPGGLRAATTTDVLVYAESITGASATRARRISTLKSLLGFASKIGFTTTNLGSVLRVPKIVGRLHEKLLAETEVTQMIKEAASGRDRVLVRLLYLSGLRISEAVGIRWIDLGPGGISVVGKGSRARTVAVPKELLVELRSLRSMNESETTRVFKVAKGKPLSVRQARRIVSTAALEGIGRPASPHWLRHAHASIALEKGCPLHVLRDGLGHASISTTSKYLAVRPGTGSGMWLVAGAG